MKTPLALVALLALTSASALAKKRSAPDFTGIRGTFTGVGTDQGQDFSIAFPVKIVASAPGNGSRLSVEVSGAIVNQNGSFFVYNTFAFSRRRTVSVADFSSYLSGSGAIPFAGSYVGPGKRLTFDALLVLPGETGLVLGRLATSTSKRSQKITLGYGAGNLSFTFSGRRKIPR